MENDPRNVLAKLFAGDSDKPYSLIFHCPGCGHGHRVNTAEYNDGPTQWTWNGDWVKPTFSPSILVSWTWGEERKPQCCHSFVTDGMIQFLPDCTHKLAGQTVPLEPYE